MIADGRLEAVVPPTELEAWLQIACFEHAARDPAYQALCAAVDALKASA